jgi:hypothetical protein
MPDRTDADGEGAPAITIGVPPKQLCASLCPAGRDRRGQHIAAVATARKLAIIVWRVLTRNEFFAWDRPAPTARKTRELELQALAYKAVHLHPIRARPVPAAIGQACPAQ